MFNFMLNTTGNGGGLGIIMLVAMVVGLMWLKVRNTKNAEAEEQSMRDNLAVGDEITTKSGIIGKVVSIKDETFVLETTKDKTKIRFLKGAIMRIDVKIADIVAAQQAEKEEKEVVIDEPAAEASIEEDKDTSKKNKKNKNK